MSPGPYEDAQREIAALMSQRNSHVTKVRELDQRRWPLRPSA